MMSSMIACLYAILMVQLSQISRRQLHIQICAAGGAGGLHEARLREVGKRPCKLFPERGDIVGGDIDSITG